MPRRRTCHWRILASLRQVRPLGSTQGLPGESPSPASKQPHPDETYPKLGEDHDRVRSQFT